MPTLARPRRFAQVDVFTAVPYRGNPVAVVLDAQGLDDDAMAAFAAWTNLSETTFVLPPGDPAADYRLRIFTPGRELPFAGHPTLGSARAWLADGGTPRDPHAIVQECGAGLVSIRRDGSRLAFAAPPLARTGPVSDADLDTLLAGLGVPRSRLVDHQWVDNGPGWVALLLDDADLVRSVQPDVAALHEYSIGVAALTPDDGRSSMLVRAFAIHADVTEDPVTGSLNAGLAQWLITTGRLPASYQASQGGNVGRDGQIFVDADGADIWVGGDSVVCIEGTVTL